MKKKDTQICPNCNGLIFKTLNDSIMKSRYRFLHNRILKFCKKCNQKYLLCQKCGYILTPIHLSQDPFCLRIKCEKCGHIDRNLQKWAKKNVKQLEIL